MSSSVANTLEVVFMAFGQSSAIGQLSDQLSGKIEQHIATGDFLSTTGKSADQYSVIVGLFEKPEADENAFKLVEQWLTSHLDVLANLDSRKIIEFQSFLDSQMGSRIVTIPNVIVQLCSNAGIDLAHQAIRVLTEPERDKLRSFGE